jgi:XTP/dITP diphosphohydrolase
MGWTMSTVIWFLTGNKGKLAEAASHLLPLGFEVRQLTLPKGTIVEPQLDSLEDVAIAKLEQAKQYIPEGETHVMVEDAGLFVEPLDGFPGIYSSYVFKTIGNQGILRLLNHLQSEDPVQAASLRSASFQAVAALWDGEKVILGTGSCPGAISTAPSGEEGFGFDPVFIPLDLNDLGEPLPAGTYGVTSTHGATFGTVSLEIKQKFSHRRRALDRLLVELSGDGQEL